MPAFALQFFDRAQQSARGGAADLAGNSSHRKHACGSNNNEATLGELLTHIERKVLESVVAHTLAKKDAFWSQSLRLARECVFWGQSLTLARKYDFPSKFSTAPALAALGRAFARAG
jgi:hypothetical protein